MPTLPSANVSVSASAGALAAGLDVVCVWAPVATNADSIPRLYGNAAAIHAYHGYSEGVEYAALHFAETGKSILFQGLAIATPGAIGREDTTGNSGTCVTAVAAGGSGVLNEHDGVLTCITGGTIGTDQIMLGLSLDGGRTTRRVRLSTANSYAVPWEGVTISFAAGTLVAGDTIHTWHGSAPKSDATGWAAARAALGQQQRTFRSVVLCGDLDTDTEASALLTQVNAYKTSNQRSVYARASVFDRLPLASLSQTTWVKTGSATLTFADADDTITRSAGSWVSDGFVVGDVITTSSVTNPGPYVVTAVTALVLTVEVGDLADEGPSASIAVTGSAGLVFEDDDDTVTRNRGSWTDDGFRVGDVVTFTGATTPNGTVTAVTATVLTLDTGDVDADETLGAAAVTAAAGQTKAVWMAAVDAEFAPVDGERRLSLSAGRGRKASPLTQWFFRRPAGWAASIREYQHDVHIAPWRKADGPTGWDLNDANGNLYEWDDFADGGAGTAAKFTTFRTWANGPNGAYIARSLTRETDSSVLVDTHKNSVVNLAENLLQLLTENVTIGADLVLNEDGTATTDSLKRLEERVNSGLETPLLAAGLEGARCSRAVWSAESSTDFSVAEPELVGTLELTLKGTIHSVTTTIKVNGG